MVSTPGRAFGSRQAAPLAVSGEDNLALLIGIAVGLRVLAAAAPALVTAVALLAVARQAVADEVFTAAVTAG